MTCLHGGKGPRVDGVARLTVKKTLSVFTWNFCDTGGVGSNDSVLKKTPWWGQLNTEETSKKLKGLQNTLSMCYSLVFVKTFKNDKNCHPSSCNRKQSNSCKHNQKRKKKKVWQAKLPHLAGSPHQPVFPHHHCKQFLSWKYGNWTVFQYKQTVNKIVLLFFFRLFWFAIEKRQNEHI